jgi:hypothetical protein
VQTASILLSSQAIHNVILSGATAKRSEALAQSNDRYPRNCLPEDSRLVRESKKALAINKGFSAP